VLLARFLRCGDRMSDDIQNLAKFVLSRGDHTRPKEKDTKKHRNSPAAIEYAARLAIAISGLIQASPPETRLGLLRRVPSNDGLLAIAYRSTWNVRKLAVQRIRGEQSQNHAYHIGPNIWDSVKRLSPDLKIPGYFGAVRLPRTLDGWIEETLRGEANLQNNAPTLWRWLKGKLQSLGLLTKIDQPRKTDPRGDAYIIAVEGHEERLSYIQFQKLLTRSRKSPKTLGDLVGTLG
jgi:hypothetical protein